mmetsp:Transcript_21300/g.35140  ORF Transcript_21300/g.35140 Transcript_21300/m.35140 type:complete len:274 (+) Transcript_21300:94-915(+)
MGNASSQPKNKTGRKVLSQKIENAKKTNILSLTEHKLEEIPDEVFHLTSLRTLDISKNKLQRLGKIGKLTELKTLNCNDNSLHSGGIVPISKLAKLQSLSLGKNQLEDFPTSLPPKIKTLKIHHNSFSSIPKQIFDPKLRLLEKLDLSSNNLASIPAEISNLVGLNELNLDNNVIVSIPNELGQAKKLKVLSLRNNYIQVKSTNFTDMNPQPIPASVFEETLLIDLNLHGNPMTNTQLNEFEGFDIFLERRKKKKTTALTGGALVNMSVCGLE